jgi:hypothetical protein
MIRTIRSQIFLFLLGMLIHQWIFLDDNNFFVDCNLFVDCRVDVERFGQRLRDLDRNLVPGTPGFHAAHKLAAPRRLGQ